MIAKLKSTAKVMVPAVLYGLYLKFINRMRRAAYERQTAAAVFDDIYRHKRWGGTDEVCSGTGSRGEAVEKYVELVVELVRRENISSIVDLGCGDFFIGRRIAEQIGGEVSYLGCDVSPFLVDVLRKRPNLPNVSFECVDAAKDVLPAGDLCLIRQVLQHLSNAQINAILSRLTRYRIIVITEHLPEARFLLHKNLDKPHGPDTRLLDYSGVCLDAAPFNVALPAASLSVEAERIRGKARSYLYTWIIHGDAFKANAEPVS